MLHSALAILFYFLISTVHSVVLPPNIGTVVNLRIEGVTRTIFEGIVFTRGHNVTTASGGTHHCDGTNNNASPLPGPTMTSALDDAARIHKFDWDGTFFTEFDDFFITSIDGDTQTDTQFWGILLNFQFTPVGGCQQEVKTLDNALFAFDAFSKVHFLKLTGPNIAKVGKPVTLTVTDGLNNNAPVAGATVEGETTDANGQVTVIFTSAGVIQAKAEKDDSIRSNALVVVVAP
ncbi:hypothetical protein BDQ17DRAFT_1312996 [Cyathus striatus]|nr:hypothetical protein BDQ17DRAFT_1312996 [Cyathus striatus]